MVAAPGYARRSQTQRWRGHCHPTYRAPCLATVRLSLGSPAPQMPSPARARLCPGSHPTARPGPTAGERTGVWIPPIGAGESAGLGEARSAPAGDTEPVAGRDPAIKADRQIEIARDCRAPTTRYGMARREADAVSIDAEGHAASETDSPTLRPGLGVSRSVAAILGAGRRGARSRTVGTGRCAGSGLSRQGRLGHHQEQQQRDAFTAKTCKLSSVQRSISVIRSASRTIPARADRGMCNWPTSVSLRSPPHRPDRGQTEWHDSMRSLGHCSCDTAH